MTRIILMLSALLLIPLSMLWFDTSLFDTGLLAIWDVLERFRFPLTPSFPATTESYNCTHEYTIELLSVDPLVVYINNYLKDEEIVHLLALGEGKYQPSRIYNNDLKSGLVDRSKRSSTTNVVPYNDVVGSCLSQRMKLLLGNIQHIDTEPLQIVKYEEGEAFRLHLDWFKQPEKTLALPDKPGREYNRLSTIFAYLESNCDGGETYFPLVKGVSIHADGNKFSRTDTGKGLLVKPRRGNAVFWNNLFLNGTGDDRVIHSSLPVIRGRKIGLNSFSYYYLDTPLVGDTL